MSEQPSTDLPAKTSGAARLVSFVVYGALVAGLAGVAFYMVVVADHALTSPYFAAPAIGALWFALRLLMIFSSRK